MSYEAGLNLAGLLFVDELLGERTTRPFREYGHFGAQFVAGREVCFRLAVFVQPLIFGNHAADAIVLVDKFRAAKFLENVNASGFHQTNEPLYKFVERDNIVARILKRRWRDRNAVR